MNSYSNPCDNNLLYLDHYADAIVYGFWIVNYRCASKIFFFFTNYIGSYIASIELSDRSDSSDII